MLWARLQFLRIVKFCPRRTDCPLAETRAMLTESQGRQVLLQAFGERGFHIQADVPFEIGGFQICLDGYDAGARVGYEFITSEDGRDEISEEVLGLLDEAVKQGRHFLFLVDEQQVDDAQHLRQAAFQFLDRCP